MRCIFDFLSNSAYVATITAIISVIVAIVALFQTHNQYKDSIQPQLSMKLLEYNNMLYLQIKNTGGLSAKHIEIRIRNIKNNGSSSQLSIGKLFQNQFELYPEEVVQDKIAWFGASLSDDAFPSISAEVAYCVGNQKKKYVYERTVTFIEAYSEKLTADENLDIREIESSIRSITRAAVRVANYLDGRQVASFDELDILAGRSLANDLQKALGQKEEPVKSREETIRETLIRRKEDTTHAHS